MSENNKKNGNPLYVVRNNGVDVEEASSFIDLLLKKTGIDQMIPVLQNILDALLAQVSSYPIFLEVKKIYDALMNKIVELIFQAQQMFQRPKNP